MMNEEKLITAQEVSKMLDVAMITVRRWTSNGYLPHLKLGKRMVRYQRAVVSQWLDKNSKSVRATRIPEVILPV